MKETLEVIQAYFLPFLTLVLSLYGWRANSEKNKLKAELKGLEASNVAKEIDNQMSWLELYKKLHDDQAQRMVSMEKEIQSLKKTIKYFENAFKKVQSCIYVDVCPIAFELQKHENNNRKRTNNRQSTNRQREPTDTAQSDTDKSPTSESEDEPEFG